MHGTPPGRPHGHHRTTVLTDEQDRMAHRPVRGTLDTPFALVAVPISAVLSARASLLVRSVAVSSRGQATWSEALTP